jgi:hypothetical protein
MKALIQKDLRENFKVAVIGLVIFSLMLLQIYMVSISALKNILAGIGTDRGLQPLLSNDLIAETACFCAIFAALLGWVQARNEGHRDLWAFLIHRPISRTNIFQGKVIAGLCLYVLGAGLPLAVFVAIVRWPGHIAAPFEWAMVLPLLSAFLAGVAFYFAGLLTGLRQARWFASRGFGLAPALIASLCVFNLPEFWQQLIVTAGAVLILAAAVRGAYQSGGYYQGQPAAGRLGLIVAMSAGCGAVLAVGAALVSGLLDVVLYEPAPYSSSQYQMTTNGIVCKVTSLNGLTPEIADLEGHPLLDPATGRKLEYTGFSTRLAPGPTVWDHLRYQEIENRSRSEVRFFNVWTISDKEIWYLDRHGELRGYDSRTRNYNGGLRPQGNNSGSGPGPFLTLPGPGNYYLSPDLRLVATAKAIYQADFRGRALKPLFSLTNDDQICGLYGYAKVAEDGADNGLTKFICLTTRKTVRLLDSENRTVFDVPFPPGYEECPYVRFSFLQPGVASTADFALWFLPDDEMSRKSGWKTPTHILWIGPGQTVARTADLPVLHQQPNLPQWPDQLAATILPPPAHLVYDNDIHSPWHLFSFAWAVISAAIGWTLTRRYNYSIPARAGWTLFILLLGIAGLLALLCVQEWPAREPCPNCKKLRAVDREFCEHCQSPFPPPEKNGTEIFAPLAKETQVVE